MKFHILVYGCQMNYSDSARIKAVLTHCGMTHTDDIDAANIIVIDTCSVRQKSEDKVFGKLMEIRPDQKVWLSGCMIQHHLRHGKIQNEAKDKKVKELMQLGNFVGTVKTKEPLILWLTSESINEDLAKTTEDLSNIVFVNHAFNPLFHKMSTEYPNVELFFRIDDTGFLPLILQQLGYDVASGDLELTNEYNSIIPHDSNQLMASNTKTAYVPISTWCSQFCAYCIVPYARGLEKNRPVDEILHEVDIHLANGVEEIVLLGQIVNKHPDFVQICKKILKKPDLRRLRYTSPYPTYFPPELLELHEHEEKMCPHIHMPLQSGSDEILKKMFRGYSVDQYKQFVDNIRNLKRPISITSDIIVGFCDETEEDFQWSLMMAEYARFDMIYIGIYSTRPGTLGARKYIDNIDRLTKKSRHARLNDLLIKISADNNITEIWSQRLMMVNHIEDKRIRGYTDNFKNIILKAPSPREEELQNQRKENTRDINVWQFLDVTVTSSEAFKLFGEIVWT